MTQLNISKLTAILCMKKVHAFKSSLGVALLLPFSI